MEIWFDQITEIDKTSPNYHESLASHLASASEADELLFFSRVGNDLKIQESFARLFSHFHINGQYRGQLRSKEQKFLKQASFEFINQSDLLPILIASGEVHNEVLASFAEAEVKIKSCSIHNKVNIDYCNTDVNYGSTGYLGVQKHFSEQSHWNNCEENCYNFLRLGKLRNELDVAEAILRDADYIDFNINAIKYGELPENANAPVTGLTIEESCQLMKYIGLSNDLKYLTISGYEVDSDNSGKIAECIAMLIWYFLEGRQTRSEQTTKFNEEACQEYLVQPNHLAVPLKFYEHKANGQWWVKLLASDDEIKATIPCSKRDYFMACNDEVSERLMQAITVL